MDRRVVFFLGASVACFLVSIVGEPAFRGVAIAVGCVYVVLSALVALDRRSR